MNDDERAVFDGLRQWLAVVLDCVDYTAGACGPTEMVGAVLDRSVIAQARAALAAAKGGPIPEFELTGTEVSVHTGWPVSVTIMKRDHGFRRYVRDEKP